MAIDRLPLSPVLAWASLTAFTQPSSLWPPSRTACGGEQAVLSALSASVEFSASQAPVKLSISTRTWNNSVKGGWGLLARFEARAVLSFGDKTATPQEGESGSGKPALSLIKAGKEGGKGGQGLRCCLAPSSCCLRQEHKELAWGEGSGCPTKESCVPGQVMPPLGLGTGFLPLCLFSSLSKCSTGESKWAWERDHCHLCLNEEGLREGQIPQGKCPPSGFYNPTCMRRGGGGQLRRGPQIWAHWLP